MLEEVYLTAMGMAGEDKPYAHVCCIFDHEWLVCK